MAIPDLPLSTPSLLFPAISLLMLAYTNRFLALATIIRNLHATWQQSHDCLLEGQISNLHHRIVLIRNMQAAGVISLIACTISMMCLFFDFQPGGQGCFGVSLAFMILSLCLTLKEVMISGRSLDIQLSDMAPHKMEKSKCL